MKTLFYLFLIFNLSFFSCHRNRPADNPVKNYPITQLGATIDTVEILTRCFSPIRIDNKKTAVWKPTLDDFFNSSIANDSLCHTNIDTIINLNVKKLVIIFRTDSYLKYHVCAPSYSISTIEKENTAYNIVNFKKAFRSFGSFGHGYDTLALEKFGKDFYLLRFSSSYVGTSTETNTNTYFDPEDYGEVFSFWTYRAVGDSSEHETDYHAIEQHLEHIKGKNFDNRDDIKLSGVFTYFEKNHKLVKKKQIEYYRINDFGIYKRSIQQ